MENDERRPTYAELGKLAAHLLADMQTGEKSCIQSSTRPGSLHRISGAPHG